ncbi:metallophosphoesterase family protein [Vallitalea guaymasensis]|uniref:metallophosphoesterase family protein n=1 Tax=Vallitalea guaymasensis TaxID=1185412 RepID=UPI002356982A|nr:YfcE family phosphodiesterase [Vallitalea guaymasensis]
MRIAVISDIHGNSVAFDRVIDDINIQNVEGVIFLGDLVSKGPDPKGVFDKLLKIKPMVWIKGNTDTWFDENLEKWQPKTVMEKYLYNNYNYILDSLTDKDIESIKKLPDKKNLMIGKYNILCVHGSPRKVDEDLLPEATEDELKEILDGVTEDIILSGHIHQPYVRKVFNKIIINPGTVGFCNCYGDSRASYAIIEFENNVNVEFRKLDYDHQVAMGLAKEKGLPNIELFEKFMKTSD